MKRFLILPFITLSISLVAQEQNQRKEITSFSPREPESIQAIKTSVASNVVSYDYDAAGNRIKIIAICDAMISIKSGDWNDGSTWSCGRIPIESDTVTISQNHTVNVPANIYSVKNIILSGTLNFQVGGQLMLYGN